MSWSYGPVSDPPVAIITGLDQVRLLIGDTDPAAPLLQDEEIAVYLADGPLAQASATLAASLCASAVASRYRRLADIREGSASVNLSQLAKQFTDLAAALRMQAGQAGVAPAAGMIATGSCGHGPAFTRRIGDDVGAGDWPHPRGRLGEW